MTKHPMRKTRMILTVLLALAILVEIPDLARGATRGWTVQSTPNHGGAAGLNAVWCGSRSACVAVGDTQNPYHPQLIRTLTEVWNGQSWTQTATGRGELTSISCWATNGCIAVGSIMPAPYEVKPLAERWNGISWKILKPANAKTGAGGFDAVSCWAANRCIATGEYMHGTRAAPSPFVALAEAWNGRSWKRLSTPHIGQSELKDVSCWSGSGCIAIGYDTSGSGPNSTGLELTEVWNGRAWKVQKAPTLGLVSVSCWSSRGCIAVGAANVGNTGYSVSAAEVWNGRSWSRQRIPVRADTDLNDVSCASRSSCIAVGSSPYPYKPITEAWNGRQWSTIATPAVHGDGYLNGVACWSSTGCMAVGGQNLGLNSEELLAETLGPVTMPAA